jgi:alkylated DNA nucleotide flippase Atl1
MTPQSAMRPENPEYRSSDEGLPDFAEAVLDIVDQIPAGMVLGYGDVAELLGQCGPRQVGSVMSRYGSSVTWWRVTRASGEAPRGLQEEALAHWRVEGTALVRGALAGRRVDMTRARWNGEAGVGGQTEASAARCQNIIPDEFDAS